MFVFQESSRILTFGHQCGWDTRENTLPFEFRVFLIVIMQSFCQDKPQVLKHGVSELSSLICRGIVKQWSAFLAQKLGSFQKAVKLHCAATPWWNSAPGNFRWEINKQRFSWGGQILSSSPNLGGRTTADNILRRSREGEDKEDKDGRQAGTDVRGFLGADRQC